MPTDVIRIEGLDATLRAYRQYPKAATAELRTEAQKIAVETAMRQQVAGRSSSKQSAKAAATVRGRRDRVPVIVAGGRSRAGMIFFGAEFGGRRRRTTQQFRPYTGTRGYWFYPTLRRRVPGIIDDYGKALDRVGRRWAAGG